MHGVVGAINKASCELAALHSHADGCHAGCVYGNSCTTAYQLPMIASIVAHCAHPQQVQLHHANQPCYAAAGRPSSPCGSARCQLLPGAPPRPLQLVHHQQVGATPPPLPAPRQPHAWPRDLWTWCRCALRTRCFAHLSPHQQLLLLVLLPVLLVLVATSSLMQAAAARGVRWLWKACSSWWSFWLGRRWVLGSAHVQCSLNTGAGDGRCSLGRASPVLLHSSCRQGSAGMPRGLLTALVCIVDGSHIAG